MVSVRLRRPACSSLHPARRKESVVFCQGRSYQIKKSGTRPTDLALLCFEGSKRRGVSSLPAFTSLSIFYPLPFVFSLDMSAQGVEAVQALSKETAVHGLADKEPNEKESEGVSSKDTPETELSHILPPDFPLRWKCMALCMGVFLSGAFSFRHVRQSKPDQVVGRLLVQSDPRSARTLSDR